MLDKDPGAARRFFRLVRKFAESTKPWDTTAIFYDTKPDEQFDLTLVSRRVYGRRDEFLTVMAAAGLDTADQTLTQRQIVLPNEGQLSVMKRSAGFESIADYRENYAPTWAQE